MSNASVIRGGKEPETREQQINGGQKQQDKQTSNSSRVNEGQQSEDSNKRSRPHSRASGKSSDNANTKNGKNDVGAVDSPDINEKSGRVTPQSSNNKGGKNPDGAIKGENNKSNRVNSQPARDSGGRESNGTNNVKSNTSVGVESKPGDDTGTRESDGKTNGINSQSVKSGETKRKGSGVSGGRAKSATSSTQRNDPNGTAATTAVPEANVSGTKSDTRRGAKYDDGAADANDSGAPASSEGVDAGLSGNQDFRPSSDVSKTSNGGKRTHNSNIRATYHSSTGPYGEKIDRVIESPRARDPPRKVPNKSQRKPQPRKKGSTETQASFNDRNGVSHVLSVRSGTEISEDDGKKEPCMKCGVNHHLVLADMCGHKVCKVCLPEEVREVKVESDCPVCQQRILYGEVPVIADHPTLNSFNLVKDIVEKIHPPFCQRCEKTNNLTEEATCACRDCALYLCEPCADAHNLENFSEGKGWKNHHIFLLDELKDQNALPPVQTGPSSADDVMCPMHDNVIATCYCKTCRRAYCSKCQQGHQGMKHDFLNEIETSVYLREIVGNETRSINYDVRAFDQFTGALRMKQTRTQQELKTQKMEVIVKCNELIKAIENKRDAVVNELEVRASEMIERGDALKEKLNEERRWVDAVKKLIDVIEEGDDVTKSDDVDPRLLRIGEFVDQNEAALRQATCSRDLVADVNNCCKTQNEVKILVRKREEIFNLVDDHINIDTIDDFWLNDEALLAKQHLRHTVDNSVCHVGAFRETELPYYQFLWPITEKYREYYGKETFILQGSALRSEEGTSGDIIQGDIYKSKQFHVFVRTGSQRLEKTEVQLFKNTEYARLFPTATGTPPVSGLVAFRRDGAEKTITMVQRSKVVLAKDDRITRRVHVGKGSKVVAVDRSGNLLVPFLIGKVVIMPPNGEGEEVIYLGSEEHAVMYTFDHQREYLWTLDGAENAVKVYDYRKLAFLHGIHNVHD